MIRKELAGLDPNQPTPPDQRARLYSAEMTQQTYAECLKRADALLWEGKRVCLDATFGQGAFRAEAFALADRRAVPCGWLVCQAPAEVVQERLVRRTHDASDADWRVHQLAAAAWEAPDQVTAQRMGVVEMASGRDTWLATAVRHLANWELAEPT